MKFKELVVSNSWLSVKLIFFDLYPDQKKNEAAYELVFNELIVLEESPVEPKEEMIIVIKTETDDLIADEPYVSVFGRKSIEVKRSEKAEDISDTYALEFTRWEEWLAMEIDSGSLDKFSQLEIVSHCLYEMTFAGFNQFTIQEEINEIKRRADEIENMTDEEREKKLIPWEKVKEDLSKRFSRNDDEK